MPELVRLAADLASGNISATDLAKTFLAKVTDSPDAFITVGQQVLDEARASDARRRRGCALSPFDGVLYAVKDNIDVAGYRTTNGSKFRLGDAPRTADAAIVATLRNAGLIVCGKSNMSELAFSGLGLNPHFGTPSQRKFVPWRAPGGSSSGSAIAVADGLVPLALGTDTAGSVRIPAAFSGVIGFRASSGRYAMTGVQPLAESFDALGALARSVADMIVFDGLTGGRQRVDRQTGQCSAFVIDPAFVASCGATADVQRAFGRAIEALEANGVRIARRPIPQLSLTHDMIGRNGWPGGFEAHRRFAKLLAGPHRESVDPRIVSRLDRAGAGGPAYQASMAARKEAMANFAEQAAGVVVMLPTVSIVPPLLDPLERDDELFAQTNLAALRLTMIGSFLDAAVVAMPAGRTDDHLPVSLSLMAPNSQDGLVLRAALQVERYLTR